DRFDEDVFHKLCNYKGSTIMISQLQGKDKLLEDILIKLEILFAIKYSIEEQKYAVYYSLNSGLAFSKGCDLII
ncbi:267_t:CDS:2, partial [Funneliformis mosseae]